METTPLPEGVHTVTATVEDFVGNVSPMTPPLTLTIDTTPPTLPLWELDAASRSQVDNGHTTAEAVSIEGVTEPDAEVRIAGTEQITIADGQGDFTFSNVPLAVGENEISVVSRDLAGNESTVVKTITRGELLPPRVSLELQGDVATSPVLVGEVLSETTLVTFTGGFAGQAPTDLLGELVNGQFVMDATLLARLNGAPLADGEHQLVFFAEDSDGLSETTEFRFTLDLGRAPTATTDVQFDGLNSVYAYDFTVSGPALPGWSAGLITVPVPTTASITDIQTPAGWTANYAAGDAQVVWSADDADAALETGESLVFGLTSDASPAAADARVDVNSDDGASDQVGLPLVGPATADGPAVGDSFNALEDGSLTVSDADGVLANDLGAGCR